MGLERIAAVLQGTHDNYKIDLFGAIISHVADLTGVEADGPRGVSHRVIADHLRASAFLIADGVLPSNEGRGYVLRRIMRRAMRHAQLLGAETPLMWRLVPTLVREMGQAYPELARAEALIAETLKLEETRFRNTLERGLLILDEESRGLKRGDRLKGETAFTLYDTYGFPLDLTQDALKPRGIAGRYRRLQQRHGAPARKGARLLGRVGRRRDGSGVVQAARETRATEFLGYETEGRRGRRGRAGEGRQGSRCVACGRERRGDRQSDAVLRRVRWPGRRHRADARRRREVHRQRYPEEGGRRLCPLRRGGGGTLRVGDALRLEVDHVRRSAIRRHHSATHILHEALRQVLGDHVAQKGSLVAPDRLRFDFSHPKPMTAQELERVEDIANDVVLENSPVTTRLMAVDDAIASGARALFGEKYGDEVRVVAMGESGGNAMGWSVELCGGTHVRRTGDIGLIAGLTDSGVAAGVRRIEALAGTSARKFTHHLGELARAASAELKVPLEEMPGRLTQLLDERRKLERELSEAKKKLAMGGGGRTGGADGVRVVGDVKLLARVVEGIEIKDLKSLRTRARNNLGPGSLPSSPPRRTARPVSSSA
jgi:alanyl-tRNA synthetase